METTAEALQEDEELIEAVENLVETAAVSVKAEIMSEVNNAWQSLVDWIEWMFPLWVLYRSDHTLFWEDLQKLALSVALLVISFGMLAPRSTKEQEQRRRHRQTLMMENNRHSFRLFQAPNYLRRHSSIDLDGIVQIKSQNRPNNNNPRNGTRRPSTSLLMGRVIAVEEEETDSERFAKNYPSLLMSRYRRLMLPPECKIVEKKAKRASLQAAKAAAASSSAKKKKKKKRRKKRDRDNYEDHPAKRLQFYAQSIFFLIRSLLSYDYMGAGMALIRWLESILRIRHLRRLGTPVAEEEEDDDDESKASISVASLPQQSTSSSHKPQHIMLRHQNSNSLTNSAPQTPDRPDHPAIHLDASFNSHALEDEKKESPFLTSASSSCAQSPPQMTLGEPSEPPMTPVVPRTAHPSTMRRRTSESSLYSTPASGGTEVVGECDDSMANLRLPLQASMSTGKANSAAASATSLKPSLGGKKKDLLENYRSSTSSSILAPTNRNTQALAASTTSQSSASISSTSTSTTTTNTLSQTHTLSSGDITTIHRNHINSPEEDDLQDENDENDIPHNVSSISDKQQQLKQSRLEEEDSFEDSSDPDDVPQGRVQRFDSDFSGYFFETANTQESIKQMLIEAPVPDKNGYIVGDEFLPDSNCTPLLVFVNSRSGPQQGQLLISQLRRLLNPIQVWDLGEDGGPETALESFCVFRNLRILVCGGDGTVSWIIAALEKMKLKRKWPPIGILPLGTGNDLARIHGWGGGYNNESLIKILEDVADSYVSMLDQWELSIEKKTRKGKVTAEKKQFFNYLGVGADAQAALQVHMLRETKPQLFFSRAVNKFWYGLFGAEDIIKATSLNLPNEITLIADGVEVPLPADSQGIILLNIDSYMGGVPFWSTGTKQGSGMHGFHHANSTGRSNGRSPLGSKSVCNPFSLRRTRSLEDVLGARSSSIDRVDSVEDLSQLLTEDQKYEQVTACDMPSSCQDGFLDIVSIRGAFHLGQVRVGLSNAQRLCQCREATIHLKRKVAVQIDGEPWRQNSCTLKVTRKPERAIMLHRSEDRSGVETEVGSLLDWAEKRQLISSDVHYAMVKEFSRRIETKTRQRRNRRDQDNIMYSLKRAIGSTGAISSSYNNGYNNGYNNSYGPSYSSGSYEYHS